jgi:hypothetical protein
MKALALSQAALAIALVAAGASTAKAADTALVLRQTTTLEARADTLTPRIALYPEQVVAPATGTFASLWGSVDAALRCEEGWCAEDAVIADGRAMGVVGSGDTRGAEAWFQQVYLKAQLGGEIAVRAGKVLVGWGPGILYSPSNRLFLESLLTSSQREVLGKDIVAASYAAGERLTTEVLVARVDSAPLDAPPAAQSWASIERLEGQTTGEHVSTAGLVLGEGTRLQTWAGAYAQVLATDAITLGVEGSVSRGFVKRRAPEYGGEGWMRSDGSLGFDALANVKYGLSSGGELALEFVANRFGATEAARADLPALLPALLAADHAGQGYPALLDDYYALAQARLPSLGPWKAFTLTLNATFAEPSDGVRLYGQLAFSRGSVTATAFYTRALGPQSSTLRFPAVEIARASLSYTL